MGYFGHMRLALGFSFELLLAVIVLGIHAFLPFVFEKTGSGIVNHVCERMKKYGPHSTEIQH